MRSYIKPISKSGAQQLVLDEKTYELVWSMHSSKTCENCGVFLGDDLRDENGRLRRKENFSHILPKGAYPEFRNNPMNFNLLCMSCHSLWEFGKRESTNVFEKNEAIVLKLRSGVYSNQITVYIDRFFDKLPYPYSYDRCKKLLKRLEIFVSPADVVLLNSFIENGVANAAIVRANLIDRYRGSNVAFEKFIWI